MFLSEKITSKPQEKKEWVHFVITSKLLICSYCYTLCRHLLRGPPHQQPLLPVTVPPLGGVLRDPYLVYSEAAAGFVDADGGTIQHTAAVHLHCQVSACRSWSVKFHWCLVEVCVFFSLSLFSLFFFLCVCVCVCVCVKLSCISRVCHQNYWILQGYIYL